MKKDHLLIPDTQCKPGNGIEHIKAAARLAVEYTPPVIINIGDWWDMPSLSLYDRGTKAAEGVRYQKDIDAGNKAMDAFMNIISKPKGYNPRLVFTMGNHEQRIERHAQEYAWLEGKIGYKDFHLDGWEVYDFLDMVNIDGIVYSHYFVNQGTGKPIGGTVYNKLNKLGFSFTQGHSQSLEFGRRDLNNGETRVGLIAGAFYTHRERYLGHQGNNHFRGLVYKHGVAKGKYDPEVWSIDRLLRDFK